MTKKFIIALLIFYVVLPVIGCSASGPALENNKWVLQSYGEQNSLKAVLADTEITAEFDKGRGEISGSGGCNTYIASYEIDGDTLSISKLAWTERACLSPEGIMEQEQEFLSLLGKAESFDVDETSLTISCSNERQLDFTRAIDK